MTTGKLIYWDACAFISWAERNVGQDELRALDEIERRFDLGEIILFTSTISHIEVFPADEQKRAQFKRFLLRSNFEEVQVSRGIAELSREIAEYYLDGTKGQKIWMPDAIHLATAIKYEVDVFHTYDGYRKPPRRPANLLALSGNVAGKYNLRIEAPAMRLPELAEATAENPVGGKEERQIQPSLIEVDPPPWLK